jgi:VanZ family protein
MKMMKWFAILFILFMILMILLAGAGRMPEPVKALYRFPNGDRLGHFILFGLLTFLVNMAFPRQLQIARTEVFYGSLIICSLAVLEEFSQLFIPLRTFDFTDLAFTILGIACADGIVHIIRRYQPAE